MIFVFLLMHIITYLYILGFDDAHVMYWTYPRPYWLVIVLFGVLFEFRYRLCGAKKLDEKKNLIQLSETRHGASRCISVLEPGHRSLQRRWLYVIYTVVHYISRKRPLTVVRVREHGSRAEERIGWRPRQFTGHDQEMSVFPSPVKPHGQQ